MKIETNENGVIVLKEVYNSIILETIDGNKLIVCMRDQGFEMKINDGKWHLFTNDFKFE